MRKILPIAAAVAVSMACAGAVAEEPRGMPRSAFFVGAGVNYSFATFANQSVYNKGISDVFQGGALIASGMADGPPVQPSMPDQSNFSPTVQIGYFGQIGNGPWIWGAKLSYAYLGTSSSVRNLVIPQFGTSTAQGVSTFDGFSVTGSYTVDVYNQTTFMPIVGRSFDRGFLYVGAGPSMSQVKATLSDVVGYATINGTLTDISGAPQTVSDSAWTFGAAATAGVTYFLTPSWFLDLTYSFVAPNARTFYVASPFSNPGTGGPSFQGTLIGTYSANVVTHAIGIKINRAF